MQFLFLNVKMRFVTKTNISSNTVAFDSKNNKLSKKSRDVTGTYIVDMWENSKLCEPLSQHFAKFGFKTGSG